MDSLNIDQKSFFRSMENQYKSDKSNEKVLQRVPLKGSVHWRCLHQDVRNTWLELSKMESYAKFSKATVCRHMLKNIGDLVLHTRKQSQQGPAKLSYRWTRNILCQAKVHQEKVGNLNVKRVMVRAGIAPSVSTAKVGSVMRKAELKWSHAHKKEVQTKSDLNLR